MANHIWTNEQLVDTLRNRAEYFISDTCPTCKRRGNVVSGPGWFCICGKWNLLPFSYDTMPIEAPDFGPTLAQINAAVDEARLPA